MNDPRYTAIWISDDMKYSINFTKCATTWWCDDNRSTCDIIAKPEAKEPSFTANNATLYGANATSAFEFFKAFHQNIDHPL